MVPMRRDFVWAIVVIVSILSTMGVVNVKPEQDSSVTQSVRTQREKIMTLKGSFVESSTTTSITLTCP